MSEGEPPDPTPPGTLGYRSVRDERPQPPKWVQALVGFVGCAAVTAAFNFFGGFLVLDVNTRWVSVLLAGLVCVAGLVPFLRLGLSLRRRGRWPAFLPGVLAGWGVAALVEGICYAGLSRGVGG
jgi:hypothetical protein